MIGFDAKKTAEERLETFVENSFAQAATVPFSFTYNGENSRELLESWSFEKTAGGVAYTSPDGLRAAVSLRTFEDFPALEWLLTFENTSDKDSGIIEDVYAVDALVEAAPFRTAGTEQYGGLDNILYYSNGSDCKADDFMPRKEILHHISITKRLDFECVGGRPTSGSAGAFPYFNLQTLDRGVFTAIGWSGQWRFSVTVRQKETPSGPDCFRLSGGMAELGAFLHPGEKIRTARMLMIFWDGGVDASERMIRRFMLKYHTPRTKDGLVDPPLPVCSWGHFAERNVEEIDKIRATGLPLDTYWVDAGWYGPAGTRCADKRTTDWAYYVGWYDPDVSRYPNGMREVSDHAHKNGMRFLLWLEPDRAVVGSPAYTAHPEYYMKIEVDATSRMLNIGDPGAYEWALEMMSERIRAYGIDILRIDYNTGPLDSWRGMDEPGRRGITEIRCVENFYRLWDTLHERFPELIIDNCASGGRRLDFEANTRAIPLFRSDYLCYADVSPEGMQVQTAGLAPYVPLNGTIFRGNIDRYTFMSFLSAGVGLRMAQIDAALEDADTGAELSRMFSVMMKIRKLFAGDYYQLTPVTLDDRDWFAYRLHLPETDEGAVISFRRENCPVNSADYRLCDLRPDTEYLFEDMYSGKSFRATGAFMSEKGLEVSLKERRSVSVIRYAPLK
jgi:alpha-galactosidase